MIQEQATNDEVFLTSNTRLATALLCLGHTLRRPPCTRQLRKDGRQTVTFLFHPSSPEAIDTCAKLAARWLALEAADPGDDSVENLQARLVWLRTLAKSDDALEFAYANAAWRDLALSIVKSTPRMVEVHAAGAVGFFREDAAPEEIRQMQKYL